MVIYISGPMSGITDHNRPAFAGAEARIIAAGHTPINPALTEEHPDGYRYYLPKDVGSVCSADAIALLHGWSQSKGCSVEIATAKVLGLPILSAYTLKLLTVTEEANEIVYGNRQATYDHPYNDFNRTAGLLNIELQEKLAQPLTARDIAIIMRAVKISRLVKTPGHRDSLVDLIGYALCEERVDRVEKGLEVA